MRNKQRDVLKEEGKERGMATPFLICKKKRKISVYEDEERESGLVTSILNILP